MRPRQRGGGARTARRHIVHTICVLRIESCCNGKSLPFSCRNCTQVLPSTKKGLPLRDCKGRRNTSSVRSGTVTRAAKLLRTALCYSRPYKPTFGDRQIRDRTANRPPKYNGCNIKQCSCTFTDVGRPTCKYDIPINAKTCCIGSFLCSSPLNPKTMLPVPC